MRKIAIVTGITSPLGRGLALRLVDDGFRVIGVTRNHGVPPNALGVHESVVCDLKDPGLIKRASGELVQACSSVNQVWVIHAAGQPVVRSLEDLSLDELEQAMWVNFLGPAMLTHGLLPRIRETAGRILWLGSMSGRLCIPLLGGYGASKAALKAYSGVLNLELSHFGAHSIYVELGNVNTGLHTQTAVDNGDFPSGSHYASLYHQVPALAAELQSKAMPLDKALNHIYAALTAVSPKPVVLIGRDAQIRATISRFAPSLFNRIARRKLKWPLQSSS
ncbi:MAG: SDR family NAD(P)-dependent oxidoreductase [Caldilineaceae bacterium]|nr:SDR family NAD(P)-dependent oxidoreductase [Caldilineaceae bacterium]